ncbi:putative mitochondrial protein [Liparis tanakae]|uniref:Putative mitochondrial protein n=1 Tax=Liparis tanakae TaxID=230148 RepID=A0A4Z2I848_9TELE|nr:putative mitochondrial protein [Liparis tanakae]
MLSQMRVCLTRLPGCVTWTFNPKATTTVTHAPHERHLHRAISSEPVKVLYDGLCPICVTEIQFLQFLQRNRSVKVDFVDISLPVYAAEKYKDVGYETAMEEMHVIDEKDEVHRGIPAFAVMYRAVGLGWLGRLMMWSPVRPFMDRAYAIFARNRLKWTGRGGECTKGHCEKTKR